MTRLTRETAFGPIPAVVTPFTEAGEIMEDAFREVVERQIAIGAGGICVAGDNGESWTLDAAERGRLTRLAVEQARGRVPVILGASAPTARGTIAYGRVALEAGAAGLLVMPQPYVLKATREELLRRFDALAKAVDLPIVAYNTPRRSGIDLTVDDIMAICDAAPVVAIKESSRDFFHHTHLLHRLRDRISVLTGPSHYILPCVALGARGFIATGPELLGKDCARIMPLGAAAPSDEGRAMHQKLTVLYQMLMGTGTWPAALKAALNLLGWPAGVPREPVLALAGAELDKVRRTLDELGLR
ncbi:dihydrodipicolinate synthase family protein [Roseomonas sp. AR75]|uniref:dihydrodipicolinate synthase family protein n=1 Tax=Roseomonas sp. AR75 TaxID=2562311 RepID=UPI0010C14C48|nr:dihydrodipicolinate synthase family protein [Roseomonas sp. AR75]